MQFLRHIKRKGINAKTAIQVCVEPFCLFMFLKLLSGIRIISSLSMVESVIMSCKDRQNSYDLPHGRYLRAAFSLFFPDWGAS